MALLMTDDSGYAVRVEGPERLRIVEGWLVASEEDGAMDAEDVPARVDEARATNPVG